MTETRIAALAGLAICLLTVSARAEEPAACGQFKWPLAAEAAWFAASPADLQSGASLSELTQGAFTIALKPSSEVGFALPPEGKPKPDAPMGAVVSFGKTAAPGKYQVTPSDEAWIDVVQGGTYRPSFEFTGVHGCPGLRKSVRFEFAEGPLVLQLSSASAASLELAIRRVPPQ